MESTLLCPSCNSGPMGRFCSNCGEQRLTHHEHSLRHLGEEALEVITHFDSKVLRSSWLLISRPGFLSSEHALGRRIRYLNPLRLFFLLSVVYYISNTIFPYNAFTTPLGTQLHQNDYYPGFAARRVERKLQETTLTYSELENRYNEETAVLSKTLVFSLIPVIALLLYALMFRKHKTIVEHVVVATHFWAFALIIIGIFIPLLLLLMTWLARAAGYSPAVLGADIIPTTIIQVIFAVYLFLMLRRVYAVTLWYSGLVAIALAWSFFHVVWLFRFLLFVLTLRAI